MKSAGAQRVKELRAIFINIKNDDILFLAIT